MILDSFGPYECRTAEITDLPAMTNFLEDLVCDASNKNMFEMEKRKLTRILLHVLSEGDAIIVTKNNVLSSVYTGIGNKILYMGNKGDIFTLAIMLKIALCDLQNPYKISTFKVDNPKHRKIYENINSTKGIITHIDENGNGTVDVKAKEAIKELYEVLKAKYE